jgi:RNA polymerase sigma-70 factor (ECF subfamily)
MTDEALVEAIFAGDRAAGGSLYDRLHRTVDGTLCRVVGRRTDDHDDLVQAAFEQILLSIMRGSFSRRCSLRSWAACIATNVGLNALRARQRRRKVLDDGQDPADAAEEQAPRHDMERALGARRELERLRAQLAAIDPGRASAVLLHDAFGHDLNEVATMMGVSVSAAQSRLVRGRRELARRMAESCEMGDDDREEQ